MNRVSFSNKVLPLAVAAAAFLGGCAVVPKPLQGEFASESPAEAVPADGARVRWGGTILSVEPKPGLTCFQIMARDLGDSARPMVRRDESEGRFLACRSGFYDPAIFENGREVTITGNLSGKEIRKIGEYDYELPRVAADTVYLWPERSRYDYHPYPYLYADPFWGFGFHSRVIVVPRHRHRHHHDRH